MSIINTVPYRDDGTEWWKIDAYVATKNKKAHPVFKAIEDGKFEYYSEQGRCFVVNIKNEMRNSCKSSYVARTFADKPYTRQIYNTRIVFSNYDIVNVLYNERENCRTKQIYVLSTGNVNSICGEFQRETSGYEESIGENSLAYRTCSQFYDEFYAGIADKDMCSDNILCAKDILLVRHNGEWIPQFPIFFDYFICYPINRAAVYKKGKMSVSEADEVTKQRIKNTLLEIINQEVPNNIKERILIIPPIGFFLGLSISAYAEMLTDLLFRQGLSRYFSKIIFDSNYKETKVLVSDIKDAISLELNKINAENSKNDRQ